MSTVSYLARRQLRHGWRSLVGIALLIAVVGGLTLGAIAGGARTATALDRMAAVTKPYDVLVNPFAGDGSALTVEKVRALPMVDRVSRATPLVAH